MSTRLEAKSTLSHLTCDLPDQAALHGLLRKLQDLGMSLISINRIERISRVAARFLTCGDYRQGVVRIRCANPKCRHEYFRPFSCKGFFLCPSCSQKRTVLFAEYLDEQLLLALPHRQFVFTLPKALLVSVPSWRGGRSARSRTHGPQEMCTTLPWGNHAHKKTLPLGLSPGLASGKFILHLRIAWNIQLESEIFYRLWSGRLFSGRIAAPPVDDV